MCTWFYADKATLSPIITKAQQLPLTDTIRNTMSRSAEMTGNIRPTDIAAVFAPNKQGNMAVFPMIWGFTVEQSSKPLINCRIETADQKPVWKDSWFRRRCVILHRGTTNGAYRPLRSVSVTGMSSAASRKRSM